MLPRDPLSELVEDHRRFLVRLSEFHGEVRRLDGAAAGAPARVGAVRSFAHFLARDVDAIHGRKEEAGLFPALEPYLPAEGGPVGLFIAEHEELRTHERELTRSADRLERDPEAVETVRALGATEGAVRGLLTDHIAREDTVLFPMARELLSERDLAAIAEVFAAIERETG